MAYCEYCGQKIDDDAKFCSSCGAPVPRTEWSAEGAPATYAAAQTSDSYGSYRIVLMSLGSCSQAAALDLLEDTIGYTEAQARELLNVIPAEAACNLSCDQAQTIARAMTEYGMQVSVLNNEGYVDMVYEDEQTSVFDKAAGSSQRLWAYSVF